MGRRETCHIAEGNCDKGLPSGRIHIKHVFRRSECKSLVRVHIEIKLGNRDIKLKAFQIFENDISLQHRPTNPDFNDVIRKPINWKRNLPLA